MAKPREVSTPVVIRTDKLTQDTSLLQFSEAVSQIAATSSVHEYGSRLEIAAALLDGKSLETRFATYRLTANRYTTIPAIDDSPELSEPSIYFDYDKQAWVVNGVYQRCGHPEIELCGCYGRHHAGELAVSNG